MISITVEKIDKYYVVDINGKKYIFEYEYLKYLSTDKPYICESFETIAIMLAMRTYKSGDYND